jgi:hypothetical protein
VNHEANPLSRSTPSNGGNLTCTVVNHPNKSNAAAAAAAVVAAPVIGAMGPVAVDGSKTVALVPEGFGSRTVQGEGIHSMSIRVREGHEQ